MKNKFGATRTEAVNKTVIAAKIIWLFRFYEATSVIPFVIMAILSCWKSIDIGVSIYKTGEKKCIEIK